jgi:hypothetical protein
MPQKTGVNVVFGVAAAQVRPRTDAGDPHLAHMVLGRFPIDLEHGRNLARAIEWARRVQLVDATLEG